ncbi:hypothetical protein PAXINDRAFT_120094 [Paxillus involutus ATCC 200175]|uniref:RBR-type E3 ubiquitin transferase n=1 Tax=Paxillus involutus ATCC 200175 TaxID=664439 RepID=A0A0C9TD63_PAXIN|nr:hypothetical protein PAXINDRAFT_120094 [Paxillus involutus ATCC 200175]
MSSIGDRRACILSVHDAGNIVRIRLSGSAKGAMGAMKVRVENLAKGEMVEGWHRSLCFSNNPFLHRVFGETGAYVRADWKRQSLKVYGAPRAVDHARDLIKNELERLAPLDYTVTLLRRSVGFFVREGIPQLKETLGENNVRFATFSRKITVTGGEEARHALECLIALSLKGDHVLPNTSQGEQTCPICRDDVSSPQQLGCGHVYCAECLRHFLSSGLDSDQFPLTCLGDGARCPAFDSHVSKHPEELKCCKTPDCIQLYRSVRPGDPARSLHCPSCFAAVCNACNEDLHEGLTCAESRLRTTQAEQDRLNDEWIASQGGRVKKCPRCSVPIEKTLGCNHMTCRCGAHICWRCMGIFPAQTIYQHMHSAHGTIHDDEPVPQVVHVNDPILQAEQQREFLRQVELQRAAAIQNHNANIAAWQRQQQERERQHEEGRVRERERLQQLERQQEEERVRERERLQQLEQERVRLARARLLQEERARQQREELMRDREMHRQLEQARRQREERRHQELQPPAIQPAEQETQRAQDETWGCTIM